MHLQELQLKRTPPPIEGSLPQNPIHHGRTGWDTPWAEGEEGQMDLKPLIPLKVVQGDTRKHFMQRLRSLTVIQVQHDQLIRTHTAEVPHAVCFSPLGSQARCVPGWTRQR